MARANLNPVNSFPLPRLCDQCLAPLPADANPNRRYCSRTCKNRAGYDIKGAHPPGIITPVPPETIAKVAEWRKTHREAVVASAPAVARCSVCVEVYPVECLIDGDMCKACDAQVRAWAREKKTGQARGIIVCHCGRKDCRVHREEKRR